MKARTTFAFLSLALALAQFTACGGDKKSESNTGGDGGGTANGGGANGGEDQSGKPCEVECSGPGTCELTADGAPHCLCDEGYVALGLSCLMPNEEGVVIGTNRPDNKGVAPLAVYFDASLTSCDGDDCDSFHELHFEWDFNDPSAETWEPSGKSRNTALGPQVAHVYKKPGTYQAVLSVHDGDEVRTSTHEIVVEDPNDVFSGESTTCISSEGNFEGCPSGAKTEVTADAARALNVCLAADGPSRCLLRRGETFARGGAIAFQRPGPIHVGTFGDSSLANPQFLFEDDGIVLYEGVKDVRIVGLHFVGMGNEESKIFLAKRRFENVLLMDTTAEEGTIHRGFSLSNSALEFAGDDLHDGAFLVNNDWRKLGFGSGGNIVAAAARRLALLGNTLLDSQGGEHVVRVFHGEKVIISNNHLGICAGTKAVLTLRSSDGQTAREFVISDNVIWGNDNWPVHLVGKNASDQVAHGVDYLIERNFVMRAPTGEDFGIQRGIIVESGSAERVTVRNNIIWMEDWQAYNGIAGGDFVYNNTCYTPNSSGSCVSSLGSQVFGNLFYAPNCAGDECEAATNGKGDDSLLVTDTTPFVSDLTGAELTPSDFALRDGSPAIEAGVESAFVYSDFTMKLRSSDDSKAHAGAMQWYPAADTD